jgi:hypothetical protein
LRFGLTRGRVHAAYRSYERISSTGNIDDVAAFLISIAEDLSQGSDMDAQVAVFDESIGPRVLYEFVFANDFAGTFREGNQQVERPTAQAHRATVLKEHFLRAQ